MRSHGNSSLFSLTVFFLLFKFTHGLQQCIPPTSVKPLAHLDFAACYSKLSLLQQTVFNDTSQATSWANSGCFTGQLDENLLTRNGCRRICGEGYTIWPWKETFDRVSLWVFPGLVLIAQFHFAPLHWQNFGAVVLHAVGDTIDSLWSLLTRFELRHRFRLAARDILPNSSEERHLVTVFTAYEELSWQDLSGTFFETPDRYELKIIKETSELLSAMRQDTVFSAGIAIGTLVGALITAVIRTIRQVEQADSRISIETAHTIAVVCLLLFAIPLVWFSARIGSFGSDEAVNKSIKALIKMRQNLEDYRKVNARQEPLFPELRSQQNAHCTCLPAIRDRSIIDTSWLRSASYLGMNGTWRPCKHMTSTRGSYSPRGLLGFALAFIIFGACGPAIFISATNHTDWRKIGYGCRSLSWTMVMALWLCSFGMDHLLQRLFRLPFVSSLVRDCPKWLWRCTLVKDYIIGSGILMLVSLVQIGLYNSCYCRSSFTDEVNLNPYSNHEWLVARILWACIPALGLFVDLGLICYIELKNKGTGNFTWQNFWSFA
jgi:hypothetical protein